MARMRTCHFVVAWVFAIKKTEYLFFFFFFFFFFWGFCCVFRPPLYPLVKKVVSKEEEEEEEEKNLSLSLVYVCLLPLVESYDKEE